MCPYYLRPLGLPTPDAQVMRNFSVHALYIFHKTLSVRESAECLRRAEMAEAGRRSGKSRSAGGSDGSGGGGGGLDVGVRRCMRLPVNRLRLDVPELFSDLTSRQVRL